MNVINMRDMMDVVPKHGNNYHSTGLKQLAGHIKTLANVEPTDGPFISCYLSIQKNGSGWKEVLDKKTQVFKKILNGPELDDFNECLRQIKLWLQDHLLPTTKGVAIFARGTRSGYFWLPMQFSVDLPNYITIYPTPNIYHLVELKDNYHSYILVMERKEGAYIMEVNLGEASIQSWVRNQDVYKKVGTEWSRMHYQVNKANRNTLYFDEKVSIIRKLMKQNELSHIILAGDVQVIRRFKNWMPKDLQSKVVDVLSCSQVDEPQDVVLATLSRFLDYEEQESQLLADRLIRQLKGQNLAVAGSIDTLDALIWDDVDTLVMSSQYNPDPGWRCRECRKYGTTAPVSEVCHHCDMPAIEPFEMKEVILRMASKQDVSIEIVEHSDALLSVGGVGCLLRY